MTEPAWTATGGVIMHIAGAPATIVVALMTNIIRYEGVENFMVNLLGNRMIMRAVLQRVKKMFLGWLRGVLRSQKDV